MAGGSSQGKSWEPSGAPSPGPIPPHQEGAGQAGDHDQAIRQICGDGWAKVQLGRGPAGVPGSAGPMARQGCGELETGPAVASLRQGLTAPRGAEMGSMW